MSNKKNKSSVSILKVFQEQSVLNNCLDLFMMQDVVSIPQLLKYCNVKYTPTTEDELWKILWCKSNMQLSWIPSINAFRWEGNVYRDKSWHWELR